MIREGTRIACTICLYMLMVSKKSEFYIKQNESKFVFASATHIKFGENAILISIEFYLCLLHIDNDVLKM